MSRFLVPVSLVAFCVAGVIAAELAEPGVTFLVLQGAGLTLRLLWQSFAWIAPLGVLFWLGVKYGVYVGRRDQVQETAAANARNKNVSTERVLILGKHTGGRDC